MRSMEWIAYFQRALSGGGWLRFASKVVLMVEMSKQIGLSTKIEYRYDNQPPPTVKEYDLRLKTGVALRI